MHIYNGEMKANNQFNIVLGYIARSKKEGDI